MLGRVPDPSSLSQKDYERWKSRIIEDASFQGVPVERLILESFHASVEQFMKSPTSLACAGVLDSAMLCVDRYLSEGSNDVN